MSWTDFRAQTALLGVAALAALVLVPTTAQAKAAPPQLSIAVDNGETSAKAGDTLTYAITVNNLGAKRVRGLHVSQTMPEGLDFTSADKSGSAARGTVVWTVDLAANGKATLHTTMEVAATPKELLRLATVACAAVKADTAPLVCATHSDLLPAGAAAEALSAEGNAAAADAPALSTPVLTGLGGLLLLAALGALVLRWRATRVTPKESGSGRSSDPSGSD